MGDLSPPALQTVPFALGRVLRGSTSREQQADHHGHQGVRLHGRPPKSAFTRSKVDGIMAVPPRRDKFKPPLELQTPCRTNGGGDWPPVGYTTPKGGGYWTSPVTPVKAPVTSSRAMNAG